MEEASVEEAELASAGALRVAREATVAAGQPEVRLPAEATEADGHQAHTDQGTSGVTTPMDLTAAALPAATRVVWAQLDCTAECRQQVRLRMEGPLEVDQEADMV